MIALDERCFDAHLRQGLLPQRRSRRSQQPLPDRAAWSAPLDRYGLDGNQLWIAAPRSMVVLFMGLIVTGLFTFGEASAQILTGPLVVAQLQDWPGAKPMSTAPVAAAPPATSNDNSVASGNPLWAIPVASFTATRERPLFSPSRRPPPPVAVVKVAASAPPPPPKPAEPEKASRRCHAVPHSPGAGA